MRIAVLIAVCVAAACYNYDPVATPSPSPGTYIAATLTDAGSRELARALGENVFVVRGRYLGDRADTLLVSVSSVEMQRGNEVDWAGEAVSLPRTDIASLEVRRLAKGRSVLLIGLGVTGLVATTAAVKLIGDATPLRPGSGPPSKQ